MALTLFVVLISYCLATGATKKKHTMGVSPALEDYYSENQSKKFECFDGSKSVAWTSINNGLCECPDCSDEPGSGLFKDMFYYCSEDIGAISHLPTNSTGGCHCCNCEDNLGIVVDESSKKCGMSRINTAKMWQQGVINKRENVTLFFQDYFHKDIGKEDIDTVQKLDDKWIVFSTLEPLVIRNEEKNINLTLDLAKRQVIDHNKGDTVHMLRIKSYAPGSEEDPASAVQFGGKPLNPKINNVSDAIPVLQEGEYDGGRIIFECSPDPLSLYWNGTIRSDTVVFMTSYFACDARAVGMAYLAEMAKNGKSFTSNVIQKGNPPRHK